MSTSPQRRNLGLSGVEVHCVGVGGARVSGYRNIRQYFESVSRHRPYLIFLHIGENDIERLSNHRIISNLLDLINELS